MGHEGDGVSGDGTGSGARPNPSLPSSACDETIERLYLLPRRRADRAAPDRDRSVTSTCAARASGRTGSSPAPQAGGQPLPGPRAGSLAGPLWPGRCWRRAPPAPSDDRRALPPAPRATRRASPPYTGPVTLLDPVLPAVDDVPLPGAVGWDTAVRVAGWVGSRTRMPVPYRPDLLQIEFDELTGLAEELVAASTGLRSAAGPAGLGLPTALAGSAPTWPASSASSAPTSTGSTRRACPNPTPSCPGCPAPWPQPGGPATGVQNGRGARLALDPGTRAVRPAAHRGGRRRPGPRSTS